MDQVRIISYGPYHMFVHLTLEFRNGAVSNAYHIIIIIMPNKMLSIFHLFTSKQTRYKSNLKVRYH